jgi:ribosomal protein S12 methylthiotransferase
MEHAQAISAARLQLRVGKSIQVLVDGIDGKAAVARSEADAPEIDGQVRITNGGKLKVGEFAQVLVTKADAYDLTARIAPRGSAARQ